MHPITVKPRGLNHPVSPDPARRRVRVGCWQVKVFVVPVHRIRPGRLPWRWMWHIPRPVGSGARIAPSDGRDWSDDDIRWVVPSR